MKLSLNDYVKLCIKRFIKDAGITELEIVITNNKKYISAPYMHVNMWGNIRFIHKKYTGYAYGTLPRGL